MRSANTILFLLLDTFEFKYSKANPGELFEGLDLLTKLLTPLSSTTKTKPLIEELDSIENEAECEEEEDDDEDGDKWFIEQQVRDDDCDDDLKLGNTISKYGFALTKSNIFSKLSVKINE